MNVLFWLKNARWIALPQSILPALTAVFIALSTNDISIILSVLAILGVACLHLSMNLFDDYFDYRHKGPQIRNTLAQEGIRARIGKCGYITEGQADLSQLLRIALLFALFALCSGVVIYYFRSNFILYWTLATAAITIQYSAPPLRWSYRGLGEIGVGVIFGPMLMIGVYYSACGQYDPSILFLSIPIGFLIANILYVHSIMDFEPDKKTGKYTLAVIINSPRWALFINALFIFLPFVCLILGVALHYLSPWYYLCFLTFPMACGLMYRMYWFVKDPKREFLPQAWMGPFQQWKEIQEAKIEWFMVRWLLARNYMTLFCLLIILLSFFV